MWREYAVIEKAERERERRVNRERGRVKKMLM